MTTCLPQVPYCMVADDDPVIIYHVINLIDPPRLVPHTQLLRLQQAASTTSGPGPHWEARGSQIHARAF